MATSSIYNNIKITSKKFCYSIVNAMEDSQREKGKIVKMSKPVEKLSKDQIEKIFGE